MRVNFASGNHPFPSPLWHNVDLNNWPGVDEKVNLLSDDWGTVRKVTKVYVGHFLEHLTQGEGYTFLYRLRNVMVPGGLAVFVGPDVDKARAWHAAGQMPDGLLHACLKHGEPDGDNRAGCHLSETTERSVTEMLVDVGFVVRPASTWDDLFTIDVPVISRSDWQYVIVANAPAGRRRVA